MEAAGALLGGGFALILGLVYFGFFIVMLILTIRLMTRGIKALDIYINKNQEPPHFIPPQQNFPQPNYPPQNFPDNQ